jgi:hypothetical protein
MLGCIQPPTILVPFPFSAFPHHLTIPSTNKTRLAAAKEVEEATKLQGLIESNEEKNQPTTTTTTTTR